MYTHTHTHIHTHTHRQHTQTTHTDNTHIQYTHLDQAEENGSLVCDNSGATNLEDAVEGFHSGVELLEPDLHVCEGGEAEQDLALLLCQVLCHFHSAVKGERRAGRETKKRWVRGEGRKGSRRERKCVCVCVCVCVCGWLAG